MKISEGARPLLIAKRGVAPFVLKAVVIGALLIISPAVLFAEGAQSVPVLHTAAFPPMQESMAYKQYCTRPVSELSKLIYLIDRFGNTEVQILYDGHYFSAPFAARVARWFLARHYRKETADKWIMRWCNTSIMGNLIWAKLPDGRFVLSREILFEELGNLEAAMKEQK